MTLLKLAETCEKASEGSFELDKYILAALGFTWRGMAYWSDDNSRMWKTDPCLTRELNSAIELVPEGWDWSVDTAGDGHGGHAFIRSSDMLVIETDAATPALALTAAALKAQAGKGGE